MFFPCWKSACVYVGSFCLYQEVRDLLVGCILGVSALKRSRSLKGPDLVVRVVNMLTHVKDERPILSEACVNVLLDVLETLNEDEVTRVISACTGLKDWLTMGDATPEVTGVSQFWCCVCLA